jgi:hypothetical protein
MGSSVLILFLFFFFPLIGLAAADVAFPRSTGLWALIGITFIIVVLTPFAFMLSVFGQIDVVHPVPPIFSLIPLAVVAVIWVFVVLRRLASADSHRTGEDP